MGHSPPKTSPAHCRTWAVCVGAALLGLLGLLWLHMVLYDKPEKAWLSGLRTGGMQADWSDAMAIPESNRISHQKRAANDKFKMKRVANNRRSLEDSVPMPRIPPNPIEGFAEPPPS